MPEAGTIDDAQIVDEASRLVRWGAVAMMQTVPGEACMFLYGPGFEVRITRTDPAADYPGKPA